MVRDELGLKSFAHPAPNPQLYRNAVRVLTQTAKQPQSNSRRYPPMQALTIPKGFA